MVEDDDSSDSGSSISVSSGGLSTSGSSVSPATSPAGVAAASARPVSSPPAGSTSARPPVSMSSDSGLVAKTHHAAVASAPALSRSEESLNNRSVSTTASTSKNPSPGVAKAKGATGRSAHFIERRDSMKFEKQHKTLVDMCDQSDPALKYKKFVKIGEGSFGTVFAAVNKATKNRVAIKKMQVTKKNKYHLETELELHLASSNHPNVVPIIEQFLVNDAKKQEVWVVLEFLENGALTETLTQLDMREADIAYVCKEVVAALSWLHSGNRVHRDIKSDNILLGAQGQVKIADFGLAIQLTKEHTKRRSILGTPYWMSPEIINGKDYDDRVDIWALGITTIEMMTKNPPYINFPKTKALFLITSQGVPLSHFANMNWSPAMKVRGKQCILFSSSIIIFFFF